MKSLTHCLIAICLSAILFTPCNITAQTYFSKSYTLHSRDNYFSSVQQLNGMYYCIGNTYDSSGTIGLVIYSGITIAVLDSFGNVVKDTVFQKPGVKSYYESSNALHRNPSGGFIFPISAAFDSLNYLGLIQLDSLGNIQWEQEVSPPPPGISGINDMVPTGTNEWIQIASYSFGSGGVSCNNQILLTKLDRNFGVEWRKVFTGPCGFRYNGVAVRAVADGYVIGANLDDLNTCSMTMSQSEVQIFKTDTSGNQLWSWQSSSDTFRTMFDFICTRDGGFAYVGRMGNTLAGAPLYNTAGWIEKLDGTRSKVWHDTVGNCDRFPSLSSIKELKDGSLVVAGVVARGLSSLDTCNNDRLSYPCLVKFSSGGSRIWQRKYHYSADTNKSCGFVREMKPTEDLGFIILGNVGDALPEQAWVIKVDSNGLLDPTDTCAASTAVRNVVESPSAIGVFPNPGNSIISVVNGINMELKISDIAGKCVERRCIKNDKEEISVDHLDNGVYLFRFTNSATGQTFERRFIKL